MKTQIIIAAIALAAIICASQGGQAGEIILVDPLSGNAVSSRGPGSRDPAMDAMTGVDRARERIAPKGSQGDGNIIFVQPSDRPGPPPTTGNPAADSRRGARDARDRAGAFGDDDDTSGGLDPNAIIIIDNGQARVLQQGERLDAATRMKIDNAKAKAYQRGGAPCGSVVVGGIGEGAAPSATSQAKDVYVLNNNCR